MKACADNVHHIVKITTEGRKCTLIGCLLGSQEMYVVMSILQVCNECSAPMISSTLVTVGPVHKSVNSDSDGKNNAIDLSDSSHVHFYRQLELMDWPLSHVFSQHRYGVLKPENQIQIDSFRYVMFPKLHTQRVCFKYSRWRHSWELSWYGNIHQQRSCSSGSNSKLRFQQISFENCWCASVTFYQNCTGLDRGSIGNAPSDSGIPRFGIRVIPRLKTVLI